MGTLEIKCHNCGAVYEVTPDCIYQAETMEAKHIYPWRCPHCLATMDKQLWDKLVNAFWTFEEVNKYLRSDNDCYCTPLMQAEYKTHFVPHKKIRI